jgi:diaminohydroxyphosphoribosylaminopyrimidine deaminase/5-amino-6-(5-phosphoribosylamino)uracil reductase
MMDDFGYMRRAVVLAAKGTGWVNPNPKVGAVLVKDGRIIGEGYHAMFGEAHAEVNAIANASEDPSGATLYVTLEPCSHQGKTPPCTDLIAACGIARVVVGITDPNPLVNGRGIDYLQNRGISVTTGILEKEIRVQNEIFVKYITTGLPFMMFKWAMTLDGKIATVTNASRWITGEASRRYVHRMRHAYSAVMVGVNTVIWDDPLLNNRLRIRNPKHPIKVIADTHGRIPLHSKVIVNDPQLLLLATTARAEAGKLKDLERMGVQVLVCPEKDEKVDLAFVMKSLGAMGIDSVMLEGGSTLAFSALREGLVDKVSAFIAPKILGGAAAPTPVDGAGIGCMEEAIVLSGLKVRKIGEDMLAEGYPGKKISGG